jgi:hypothetical protein
MSSEARITINGIALTTPESMTVRLAMDALANILGEQSEVKDDGLTDAYMLAINRVRALLAAEAPDASSMN